jgi:carboxyl-terminal processing protease
MATMKSNRSRLLFVAVSIGALVSLRAAAGPEGTGRDPATRALSIFSEVFSLTRSNYVEPTESKALLEGAYDGMSDALDPFSYYVPVSALAAYRAQESAGAAGPGIVFARRGGYPYVVAPLPGSPAEKAGIKAGDLIDSVDGKTLRNAPYWKVKAALEGPEGSTLELGVFRGGDEKKLNIPVTRGRFEPTPVSATSEKDVIVLKIPSFTPTSAAAVKKQLDDASKGSVGAVVLDLRGSIGGDPADAVPVAALFLGKGTVATIQSRKVAGKPLEVAAGEPAWTGRVVILMDDSTAGPAEILAAALHDRAKATTVGETTVGMGVVQRGVPTEEGGLLYMTVGRYVSPSGQVLGGKGLTPDERVIVFPGEESARDRILERGLEIARSNESARRAA